ncbi:hypothetical protein [Margalitia sp. FSL K6-0131]
MMHANAGCLTDGKMVIENSEVIKVSYPTFFKTLRKFYEMN